ncbi:MAG: DUF481 domain-containing protein [bacterium]
MRKYLIIYIIMVCGLLNFIKAQTNNQPPPLAEWWLSSSLADSAEQYLFHVEGQYSFTKMTGAIEGEMHSGGILGVIRKNIFTNHITYMIDKMNLNLKSFGMNYITESHVFSDYLDIDITRLLYGEVGFIWERDNSLYINNRYSLYAGLGLNGLVYDRHYVKLLIAIGRIDQGYTIPVDNFDVVKGVHSEFYIRQEYKYAIDSRFSFTEQAYYLTNTKNYDRYRIGFILNFNIVVVQPVSLTLGYNYRFDKESQLLGAIAENTTQTIGIKVSF